MTYRKSVSRPAMKDKAWYSFGKSIAYLFSGRLHFKRALIGETISRNGYNYTVFRRLEVKRNPAEMPLSGATLTISFSFGRGTAALNKKLSLIPVPFIVGLPGFRSKTWATRDDNGDFLGIYEWDTLQDIEKYKQSFAIKLMMKRAVPGSVKFRVSKRKSKTGEKASNEKKNRTLYRDVTGTHHARNVYGMFG